MVIKPLNNPLGISPSKGNQPEGTTQGKEKNPFDLGGNRTHDLRIGSTVTLPTELQGWTEKVGIKGSIPPRSKTFFFTLCGSLITFTRANAEWVIHGFN